MFQIETRDLSVTVGGTAAFAHWLFRFTGPEKDHPSMQTWMRLTACCQKVAGEWRVVHEHVSVPFDPMTGQTAFSLDVGG